MARSALHAAAAAATLLLPACVAAVGRGGPGLPLAFAPPSSRSLLARRAVRLASAAVDDVPSDVESRPPSDSVFDARDSLLDLASSLASSSPAGIFLSRPSDKRELQKAIQQLEAIAPSGGEEGRDSLLLGDWTLVATATLPGSDVRRRLEGMTDGKKRKGPGWFKGGKKGGEGPLNPIQKALRKSFEVTQRIRNDGTSSSSSSGGDEIDRVDNVVEFTPLNTLEDVLPEGSPLMGLLGSVNVNPLQVERGKAVLIHKAEVESVNPVLRTKIALVSTVVNVAGTSQFLNPEGEDVFGVNNLLGDFINVGTFDTPYVDEHVRVSRTSGPISEQLRVFVRKGGGALEEMEGMEGMEDGEEGAVAAEIVEEGPTAETEAEGEAEGKAEGKDEEDDAAWARKAMAASAAAPQVRDAVEEVEEDDEDDRTELEGEFGKALEGMVADVTGSSAAEGDATDEGEEEEEEEEGGTNEE